MNPAFFELSLIVQASPPCTCLTRFTLWRLSCSRCSEWTEQPRDAQVSLQPDALREGRDQQSEEGGGRALFTQVSGFSEEPPGPAGCGSTHAGPEERQVKDRVHGQHQAPARRWKGTWPCCSLWVQAWSAAGRLEFHISSTMLLARRL